MPNIPISSLPLTTSVCSNGLIPIVQNGVTFSTYSCLVGTSGGGCGGNINCVIAGNGISISPSTGVGDVTICATGSGGTGNVTSIIAGCAIFISPSVGTGFVTICATGTAAVMVEGIGACSIVGNCSVNTASADYSFIGGGCNNNTSIFAPYSFIGGGANNQVNSCYGSILGGFCNTVNAPYSGAFGCCINANLPCTFFVNDFVYLGSNSLSSIPNGCAICINTNGILTGFTPFNSGGVIIQGEGVGSTKPNYGCCTFAIGEFSSILGGANNNLNGTYSFAVGLNNSDSSCSNVVILGSKANFCSTCANTTYVEQLSIQGINCGCVICVGVNQKTLEGFTYTPQPDTLSVGTACDSVIRCGVNNVASACGAFAAAGCNNCITNCFSNITGGSDNLICSQNSTIFGGNCNEIINSQSAAIGGGFKNTVNSFGNTGTSVLGGGCNIASGLQGIVAGGFKNVGNAILGGECNNSGCVFIGGGFRNNTQNCSSTVMGGCCNTTFSSRVSFMGGGLLNTMNGFNSSISGGYCNLLFGNCAYMGNGCNNRSEGQENALLNGECNRLNQEFSIMGTGFCNTSSSFYTTMINGFKNFIGTCSICSSILSGNCNIICNTSRSLIYNGFCNQSIDSSGTYINNGYQNIVCCGNGQILNGCLNNILGGGLIINGFCNSDISGVDSTSILGGSCNTACANFASIFGCNIVNNTPCSFMSNQLRACNLFGAGAICADANGVISSVSSDITIKKDILPINYGIKHIICLNPISYIWKDEHKNGGNRKIGFIAQEVEGIIPESVFKTSDGFYGLDDKSFIPIFAKSIQEIEIKLSELEREFDLISSL